MNNLWRKFCDEFPTNNDIIVGELINNNIVELEDYFFDFHNDNSFDITILSNYTDCYFTADEETYSQLYWKNRNYGWLFPEEVTGDEVADYWLFKFEYRDEVTSFDKTEFTEGDLGCFKDYVLKHKVKLLKPMEYDQPPEWMINIKEKV